MSDTAQLGTFIANLVGELLDGEGIESIAAYVLGFLGAKRGVDKVSAKRKASKERKARMDAWSEPTAEIPVVDPRIVALDGKLDALRATLERLSARLDALEGSGGAVGAPKALQARGEAAERLSGGGCPYPGRPIRRGWNGECVRAIQTVVGVAADGSFGAGTERAVMLWQRANGLSPDGVVGPLSWAAMFGQTQTAGGGPIAPA